MIGHYKSEVERIHKEAKQQIRNLQKRLLTEYFQQITETEQLFFNRIFPFGVPKSKMNQALDLLERTIDKNNSEAIAKILQGRGE